MTQRPEDPRATQERLALLSLARQFRDAASRADRPDVVAKIDEAVLLLAGPGDPAGRRDGDDRANLVVRILDGLGL